MLKMSFILSGLPDSITAAEPLLVSWRVSPTQVWCDDHTKQTGKEGTNHFPHPSLFYSFCPPFIFLSDSMDTSIHLSPHSITSHHCVLRPTSHPFNLTLIPLFPPSTSVSPHFILWLPSNSHLSLVSFVSIEENCTANSSRRMIKNFICKVTQRCLG